MACTASIVILFKNLQSDNENEFKKLRKCIEMLCRAQEIKKIAIIDNSPLPTFDSVKAISDKITYVHMQGINAGYGKAHNISRYILPECDYHLICNPDITIKSDKLIAKLEELMNGNKKIAMIQPNILNEDSSTPQYLCKKNPTLLSQVIRFTKLEKKIKWAREYNNRYEMRR